MKNEDMNEVSNSNVNGVPVNGGQPINREQPINIEQPISIMDNTEDIVSQNTPVTPIPEVEATLVSNENNEGNKNTSNQEPPKGGKGKTIGLVLLFVFFFVYVMGMPYIRDFISDFKSNAGLSEVEKAAKEEEEKQQKEKDKQNNTQKPVEEKLEELVCTSQDNKTNDYTLNVVEKFQYSNNKIKSSSVTNKYTFLVQNESYNTLKKSCDEDALKFATKAGYTMTCNYSDTEIEIANSFDLEIFKKIVDGTTTIDANTTYQKNINDIRTEMSLKGYTCQ